MPFQAVPRTISLECNFLLLHLLPAQFTVFCNNDAEDWDGAAMAAKAADVSDAIIADYLPALCPDHDFVGVTARDLSVHLGRVVEHPVAATPGTLAASPSLPTFVAPVGTWHAEVGAPRQGHVKLMAPAESQVVGNALSGGAIAALQAALDAIAVAVTDGVGPSHVILSRFSGSTLVEKSNGETRKTPTPRVTVEINNVQSGTINPILGVQKSRRL